MSWDFLREWGTLALALAIAGERVLSHVLRTQFATTADLLSVHKSLSDEQIEQDKIITQAKHRLELMAQEIETLPGYTQFNQLRDDVVILKEGQAVGRAKLDHLKDGIDLVRGAVDRLSDDIKAHR